MTHADNRIWKKLQDSLKRSCKFSVSLQWFHTMNWKHFNIRKWSLLLPGFLLRCAWAGGRIFIRKHSLAVLLSQTPCKAPAEMCGATHDRKARAVGLPAMELPPRFHSWQPTSLKMWCKVQIYCVCPFEWWTSCRMTRGNTSFNKSEEVLQEPRGSFITCFILVLLSKVCKRQHLSEWLKDILWGRPTNYRHPLPVTVEV